MEAPPDPTGTENDGVSPLAALRVRVDELGERLDAQVGALEDALFRFNPFSVLGNVWLANAITDIETYREYSHEGNDAFTEYVATVYLTRALTLGDHGGLAPFGARDLAGIQGRVEEIFLTSVMLNMAKQYDPDASTAERALSTVRFKTLTKNTAGRYPAYHHHLERTLRGILVPLDALLVDHFGFGAGDALALAGAVEEVTLRKVNDHIRRAVEARDAMLEAVAAFEAGGTVTDGHPVEFLQQASALNEEGRRHLTTSIAAVHSRTFLGGTLLFTADEIATLAGVSVERAQSFAERLSVRFGDVDPRWFRHPSATPPLQARPLIRVTADENPLGTGEAFFCPVPQGLLWALRTNLEAGLNPATGVDLAPLSHPSASTATWDRYERARSAHGEKRTLELFKALLPGATVHRGLKYDAPDVNGDVGETELDGLVVFDDALFLIEVKAGTLSPPARRGAPDSLLQGLRDDLLGEGHRQALRAKRYVEGTAAPTFRKADRSLLTVDMSRVRRTFMVVVTLEDLAAYTANMNQLRETGLLASDDEFPWAVNIYDLETVAELVDSPSVFVHFLEKRLAKDAEGKTVVTDEMDWIGAYFQTGLDYSEQTGGDPDMTVIIPSATTEIDDYFYYTHGPRETPAEKPAQPLPYPLSSIVTELERQGNGLILPLTMTILDLPINVREPVAQKILASHTLAWERRRKNVVMIVPPGQDFGLTYIASPPGTNSGELQDDLDYYLGYRKYQQGKDRWLAFAAVVGRFRYVDYVVFNDQPWQRDEVMDAALTSLGEVPLGP